MPPSSPAPKWLPSFVNRLALKIAGTIFGASTVGVALLPSWPLWQSIVALFSLGGVAYLVAHYWLHTRLGQVRSMVQHIRRHTFNEVTSPSQGHTDELDRLLWETYRTGQTVENEVQVLKERENDRREFLGNVSHELKTPIFSAQGFAETLLDGALEDEEVNRSFLRKILRNISRLENLARDLSAITKIETGKLKMSTEAVELTDLSRAVRDSLELKANEKNVTLQSDLAEDLPPVHVDPDRIRRVMVNLVDNAIKYNEDGGTVVIRARPLSSDEVEIQIVDDGIGIPPEHLSRLTERFYRVDKSRSRNQGGTGLGLAIVKHILAAHDRSLDVESTPGEGSTFRFTLPTKPVRRPHSE